MQDYERKGGIHSKVNTKEFEDNFDRIFRANKKAHEDKCPCTNDEKDSRYKNSDCMKEEHDNRTD